MEQLHSSEKFLDCKYLVMEINHRDKLSPCNSPLERLHSAYQWGSVAGLHVSCRAESPEEQAEHSPAPFVEWHLQDNSGKTAFTLPTSKHWFWDTANSLKLMNESTPYRGVWQHFHGQNSAWALLPSETHVTLDGCGFQLDHRRDKMTLKKQVRVLTEAFHHTFYCASTITHAHTGTPVVFTATLMTTPSSGV